MCGGGKGDSSTTTQSSNSTATQAPPDYLNSAYQSLVGAATNIAQQPLQQYQGQLQAGFSPLQQQGLDAVQNSQGAANPYIDAASSSINASQTPLWNSVQQFSPSNIQQYENPYQSDVVNATMAQINQLNQQQQSQLQGNAVSNHALGGDRAGIAAASLANQQGLAAGQTLSQLNNQNYAQAANEFNTQQSSQLGANEANSWLNSQAGSLYGNLGNEALNTSLTGSNALLNAGSLQQQQAQGALNIPYEEYLQQQAFPYQDTQYLANILEGIGGVAGGTTTGSSSGTTTNTQSSPSLFSQLAGLGVAGAGILGGSSSDSILGGLLGSGSGTTPTSPFTGATPVNTGNPFASLSNTGSTDLSNPFSNINFAAPQSASGGRVHRKGLAAGGAPGSVNNLSTNQQFSNAPPFGGSTPDVDVSFIPPPSGVMGRANFPQLPQNTAPQGGGGGKSGGGSNPLGEIGQMASIAAMFMKRGGLVPNRMSRGGMPGNSFGAMSAARHSMPKINIGKVPDLLKTPKFDDGGAVGGLMPSAATASPIVQNAYQRYAQQSPEKLQEMSVRAGGGAQGGLINKALMQKRMMPNVGGASQQGNGPSGIAGMAKGGVSRETYRHGYATDGAVMPDDDGISIPYPPPSDMSALPYTPIPADPSLNSDTEDLVAQKAPPVQVGPDISSLQQAVSDAPPSASADTVPVGGGLVPRETLPPAQHYAAAAPEKADPWSALTQAGLAMMAGPHKDALRNIAEGGLYGMKAYEKEKQDASDRTYKTGQINDAVDKLNQEADTHRDTMSHEQEVLDQAKIKDANENTYRMGDLGVRQREADLKAKQVDQGKWVTIKDAMGNEVSYNPQSGQMRDPFGITGNAQPGGDGKPSRSLKNVYEPPNDKDGKPLTGDDYYATVPPTVAAEGKLIANGDRPPPGSSTRNPVLLASEVAAKNGDPSYRGTRYATIQEYTKGGVNSPASKVQSQSVAMEHLGTLHDAVDALNNGDIPLFNKLSQEVARQTGQAAPTNFDFGKNLVFDEVAKAVLPGGGALADREAFAKNMTDNSSRAQAMGQLSEAEKYMAGQGYGLQQRWENGTGWDENAPADKQYRNRFLTPRAKSLMDKYYPADGSLPQGTDKNQQPAKLNYGSVPPPSQREVGKVYPTPRGDLKWMGTGWAQ